MPTAQAFRPHVIDMFEPQDHPNVIPYPGAPPTPPYDNAGWTLALQMGVQFDRILEPFSGPFERVTDWNVKPSPGRVATAGSAGYRLSRAVNDSVIAVNRLLAAGDDVSMDADGFVVGAKAAERVQQMAKQLGVEFGAASTPAANPVKIAAGADRAVGPVRRIDGVGLDALDPRAVRVQVRTRVRAATRCGRA